MIFVDNRVGSKELARLLPNSIEVMLEFGDVYFDGNGPEGVLSIGIERKKINDLVNSIATGRLSGYQIPGLQNCYNKIYLIVEGKWSSIKSRRFTYESIWSYLMDLESIGITVRYTKNINETVQQIERMHHWWSKPWDAHKGLKQVYHALPTTAILHPLTPYERSFIGIASSLPGIEYERAKAVMKHFKSVNKMINASEEEWREVEGIGKVIARNVWNVLHRNSE